MLTIAFKFVLATTLAGSVVFGAMAQAYAHGNASALSPRFLMSGGAQATGAKINGPQETGSSSSRFALYGTDMPAAKQAVAE